MVQTIKPTNMHKNITLKAYISTWVQNTNNLDNSLRVQNTKHQLKEKKNVKTLPLR